jgi:hypothetical protein
MATAKKVTAKKASPKRVKKVVLKSFKLSPEIAPFVSFHITDQTVYWSILLILILVLALWVLQIQVNISNILDSIKTTI